MSVERIPYDECGKFVVIVSELGGGTRLVGHCSTYYGAIKLILAESVGETFQSIKDSMSRVDYTNSGFVKTVPPDVIAHLFTEGEEPYDQCYSIFGKSNLSFYYDCVGRFQAGQEEERRRMDAIWEQARKDRADGLVR